MAMVLIRERATVEQDGSVKLPERVRKMGRFQVGDELAIWWLPPDEIVMRKVQEQNEEEFAQAMREFGSALRAAGYDTDEKIIELVREVKREQVREWFEKRGLV